MNCASYWDWTEECRKAGCKECGTLTFAVTVPPNCSCPIEIAGFVLIAQRNESCPVHGRCLCGNGPSKYDDRREADYYDRAWKPECPLVAHRS